MSSIVQVVQEAMCCGYLTAEAEQTLCQYFNGNCNLRDITALTMLQRALLSGRVQRRSQEKKQTCAI